MIIRFVQLMFLSSLLVMAACGQAAVPTSLPTAEVAARITVNGVTANEAPTVTLAPATSEPTAAATEMAPPTATRLPTRTVKATAAATETASASPRTTTTSAATETQIPDPTATSASSVTAAPAATAAAPPPPGDLEQPPYAPSACSDKYPCNDDVAAWEARIRVPAGYQDTYFARVNGNPTSIAFGPLDGLLYVATLDGTIHTVDRAGNAAPYVGGFLAPTGIAFQPGTGRLFVASRLRNDSVGGEAQVSVVEGGGISQLYGGLPCCYAGLHAANGIAFGPDGFGYIGVGGRADHGEILLEGPTQGQQDELHPLEAAVVRFDPNGGAISAYARGLRNPYDIAWDANGQLFATDNAPDYGPPEELHRIVPGGQHGYPWYDCDICFKAPADIQVIPPIYNFPAHTAPTGIVAYRASQFPGYFNSLFVVLWSAFPGAQKVMRFGPGGVGASNFALGFAQPIDVAVGPDGALYVADYATGIIFKVAYTG